MKDRIQTVAYLLCLVVSLLILSMLIFQGIRALTRMACPPRDSPVSIAA